MRIFQILSTLLYGNAVGNSAILLKRLFRLMGYQSEIYADSINDKRLPADAGKLLKDLPPLNSDDIVLWHVCGSMSFKKSFMSLPCYKILVYRNITPSYFFRPYDSHQADHQVRGVSGAAELAGVADYNIAMSEYSKNDLIEMGYEASKIGVVPVYVPMKDYEQSADLDTLRKYSDGATNILFVGRLAPNKCTEDIIQTFAYYKKRYNPAARLILAGKEDTKGYQDCLQQYVDVLNVSDVLFLGHASFSEILACYRCADVFLCMSEHEGFCVPLVEAMYFDVPIIAYHAAAIPETLGGSGILIDKKDFASIAAMIDRVVCDKSLRDTIICGQRNRLKAFDETVVVQQYATLISSFIDRVCTSENQKFETMEEGLIFDMLRNVHRKN